MRTKDTMLSKLTPHIYLYPHFSEKSCAFLWSQPLTSNRLQYNKIMRFLSKVRVVMIPIIDIIKQRLIYNILIYNV